MCLAAMRMAGISQIFYAYSNDDAQPYGLSSTANIAKALRVAPEQQEGLQFVQIKPEDEKQPALYQLWSPTILTKNNSPVGLFFFDQISRLAK